MDKKLYCTPDIHFPVQLASSHGQHLSHQLELLHLLVDGGDPVLLLRWVLTADPENEAGHSPHSQLAHHQHLHVFRLQLVNFKGGLVILDGVPHTELVDTEHSNEDDIIGEIFDSSLSPDMSLIVEAGPGLSGVRVQTPAKHQSLLEEKELGESHSAPSVLLLPCLGRGDGDDGAGPEEEAEGGEVEGGAVHGAHPGEGVGVVHGGPDQLPGTAQVVLGSLVAQLSAGEGQGAEEEMILGDPLDRFDQHRLQVQCQPSLLVVGAEELPVILQDLQGEAVVDAVAAVLPGQPALLCSEQFADLLGVLDCLLQLGQNCVGVIILQVLQVAQHFPHTEIQISVQAELEPQHTRRLPEAGDSAPSQHSGRFAAPRLSSG